MKIDPKARYQGYTFFFKEGFCWNNVLLPSKEESMFIKARIKSKSVNDVASMSLYSLYKKTPNGYLVSLLCSKLFYDYLKTFINNTVNLQINDFRLFPICIPSEEQVDKLRELFTQAVANKKSLENGQIDETYAKDFFEKLQKDLDKKVTELYGI